jgi:hypothetical protein
LPSQWLSHRRRRSNNEPCLVLSLDLIDIIGELQRDTASHIMLSRLVSAAGTAVLSSKIGELRNDIDKLNEQRASGYCGSRHGREPPMDAVARTMPSAGRTFERVGASANLMQLTSVYLVFLSSTSRADSERA